MIDTTPNSAPSVFTPEQIERLVKCHGAMYDSKRPIEERGAALTEFFQSVPFEDYASWLFKRAFELHRENTSKPKTKRAKR